MKILVALFFGSLLLGQLGAIPVAAGATIYAHDIFLVLLLIYTAFHLPKKKPRAILGKPIIIFFAITLVSLLVNMYQFPANELAISALYALRWGCYAMLYVVVMMSPLEPRWWARALYGTGVGIAILGLAQYIWYPYLRNLAYLGWDPHLYRVFSTLLDPNFAAIIFVMTLFLGIYLWRNSKYRWVIVLCELVVLGALFLTYSRSGYLAFIAGIGVLAWAMKKGRIAIVGVVCFLAILFLLPRVDGEGVKLLRTASSAARIGNWQRGMTLIAEAPLFGHGFDTLRYVQTAKGWVSDQEVISHAGAGIDNSLQFIWATTGVVGFAAYMWIFVTFATNSFVLTKTTSYRLLGAVGLATMVSMLVDSQFGNSIFYPWVLLWFWILAAIVEKSTR